MNLAFFKSCVLAFIFLCLPAVYAAGTFNMSGKLKNANSTSVDIEDSKKVYTILRKSLGAQQDLLIKQTKNGGEIMLQVPFDAVDKVSPKPKK